MNDLFNDIATETEQEVITVNQGRSSSPYFCIIQPANSNVFPAGKPIKCINPKTKKIITGVVTNHRWTIDWDEMPVWAEVQLLIHYGVSPKLLRTVLIASDPGFADSWARLILIRETI